MTKQLHMIAVEIDNETGAITALSQISTVADDSSFHNTRFHNIKHPDFSDSSSKGWSVGGYKGFRIFISQESVELGTEDITCPDCQEVYTRVNAETQDWVCIFCRHSLSSLT